MPEGELRERITRVEVRIDSVHDRLKHIDKSLEDIKGNLWKLLTVAGLSAGGGSAVAKLLFT